MVDVVPGIADRVERELDVRAGERPAVVEGDPGLELDTDLELMP